MYIRTSNEATTESVYMYSQPCKGESTSHASTLWFTATSPKQQRVLAKKESI